MNIVTKCNDPKSALADLVLEIVKKYPEDTAKYIEKLLNEQK